jgi:hypothetical protein
MTLNNDPNQLIKMELSCPNNDEIKLIELLLSHDIALFDIWHTQRYGIQANLLNLVEQVRGYRHYSNASCILSYTKAIEIKNGLHQHIPHADCQFLILLACEGTPHHA